ncbi:MAG: fused response regulator/phosphatase [Leptospiraceae bacterium]|nr:fused response regulator/phosphatase [Leptospiraceae bacterium]
MDSSILIIDDEKINLEILKKILRKDFEEIHSFTSSNEALEFMKQSDVDIILSDQNMPEISGIEFISRIKENKELSEIPVIIISADQEVDTLKGAFKAGAVDYITKPFRAEEVRARVNIQLQTYYLKKQRNIYISQIENQKLLLEKKNIELKNLYEEIEKDLKFAAQVQSSLIPTKYPKSENYILKGFYEPYSKIGGDSIFYKIKENSLYIFFGDISGHGISAALMSGMILLAFQFSLKQFDSPDRCLDFMNKTLVPLIKHHHISAVFLIYDFENNILKYSYGGHHEIFKIRDGEVSELEGKGSIMIIHPSPTFRYYEAKLEKGDKLLLFSDGLFEVYSKNDDFLGLDKFKDLVINISKIKNIDIIEELSKAILNFSNNKLHDDMTLLMLETL